MSADARTPAIIGPAGVEEPAGPGLRVAGDVVVTALKPAEDGRGAILRAVNAAAGASAVTIDGDAIATAIPLDETPLDEAPGWARPNELRPGEIRTRRPTGA